MPDISKKDFFGGFLGEDASGVPRVFRVFPRASQTRMCYTDMHYVPEFPFRRRQMV